MAGVQLIESTKKHCSRLDLQSAGNPGGTGVSAVAVRVHRLKN